MDNSQNEAIKSNGQALAVAEVSRAKTPKRGGRPSVISLLSAEEYAEYLKRIELGAFDHIAAQSLGVLPETFYGWIAQGRSLVGKTNLTKREKELLKFYQDTMKARGHARFMAEMEVKHHSAQFWLARGPGKRDWSERIETESHVQVEQENVLSDEEKQQVQAETFKTLADTLRVFDELGFIKLTEEGTRMFQQQLLSGDNGNGHPIEVTAEDLED